MKLLYILQLLLIHLLVSLIIGIVSDNMSYRFWTWVLIGIPVNLIIGAFFLRKSKAEKLIPVENEEIFDHLFIQKNKLTIKFK